MAPPENVIVYLYLKVYKCNKLQINLHRFHFFNLNTELENYRLIKIEKEYDSVDNVNWQGSDVFIYVVRPRGFFLTLDMIDILCLFKYIKFTDDCLLSLNIILN